MPRQARTGPVKHHLEQVVDRIRQVAGIRNIRTMWYLLPPTGQATSQPTAVLRGHRSPTSIRDQTARRILSRPIRAMQPMQCCTTAIMQAVWMWSMTLRRTMVVLLQIKAVVITQTFRSGFPASVGSTRPAHKMVTVSGRDAFRLLALMLQVMLQQKPF